MDTFHEGQNCTKRFKYANYARKWTWACSGQPYFKAIINEWGDVVSRWRPKPQSVVALPETTGSQKWKAPWVWQNLFQLVCQFPYNILQLHSLRPNSGFRSHIIFIIRLLSILIQINYSCTVDFIVVSHTDTDLWDIQAPKCFPALSFSSHFHLEYWIPRPSPHLLMPAILLDTWANSFVG